MLIPLEKTHLITGLCSLRKKKLRNEKTHIICPSPFRKISVSPSFLSYDLTKPLTPFTSSPKAKRSSRYTTNAVHVTVLQAFPKTRLSKYTPTYYQRRPAIVCLPLMLSPSFRIAKSTLRVCSGSTREVKRHYR